MESKKDNISIFMINLKNVKAIYEQKKELFLLEGDRDGITKIRNHDICIYR